MVNHTKGDRKNEPIKEQVFFFPPCTENPSPPMVAVAGFFKIPPSACSLLPLGVSKNASLQNIYLPLSKKKGGVIHHYMQTNPIICLSIHLGKKKKTDVIHTKRIWCGQKRPLFFFPFVGSTRWTFLTPSTRGGQGLLRILSFRLGVSVCFPERLQGPGKILSKK